MTHKLLDWMPWYPTDFWGSLRVLRLSEPASNLYRWMLDYQWIHGSVPDDAVVVSRLYPWGASALDSWREVRPLFDVRDGVLINPRLAEVYEESAQIVARKSLGGLKSAKTRKERYGTAAPGAQEGDAVKSLPKSVPKSPRTQQEHLTGPDLIGAEEKAASPPLTPVPIAKPRAEASGDHAGVGRWFSARFLEATGKPYAYERGKDGKAVKNLLGYAGIAGVPEIEARGAVYFGDDFYRKSGFTLTRFASAWNALAQAKPGRSHLEAEISRYRPLGSDQ